MAEELTSISKARASLTRLSRAAKRRMHRYIITHEGLPQSVLVGFDEYLSMKAAVDLMQHPEIVADIQAGLHELDEGKGISPAEMKQRVRQMERQEETARLATEISAASGVDPGTVEAVMDSLAERILSQVESRGRASIPGVGEVVRYLPGSSGRLKVPEATEGAPETALKTETES